jgi:hypothetical protein
MSDKVEVEVRRNGRTFVAEAMLDLGADLQSVWDTITDYPALPRFMPGIRACQVNTRQAHSDGSEHLVVEQQGEFRFLMFAQSMKVLLNIEHRPLQWAQAKAVRFELGMFTRRAIEVFEGRYALSPISTDTQAPRTHRAAPAAAAGHRQRCGEAQPGGPTRSGGPGSRATHGPCNTGAALNTQDTVHIERLNC